MDSDKMDNEDTKVYYDEKTLLPVVIAMALVFAYLVYARFFIYASAEALVSSPTMFWAASPILLQAILMIVVPIRREMRTGYAFITTEEERKELDKKNQSHKVS